ncbi:MAG: hypothetical protein QOF60_2904 [Actinomycetota bacterium]|jgi:hypothetical protein|nr:hypothetical protein [Actinomycetota bacterium]
MRKLALLVLAVCINLVVPAHPAGATTTTVHLDVDLAIAAPLAGCDVNVPSGSNGLAVLDQAVTDGCIASYRTRTFAGLGEKVTCINDLCETPDETLNAVTWVVYVDGRASDLGVSSLNFPTHGTRLQFSFEPWAIHAPCWFGGVCP